MHLSVYLSGLLNSDGHKNVFEDKHVLKGFAEPWFSVTKCSFCNSDVVF